MTNEEKAIMGDMFYFLRDHNEPPPTDSESSAAYWEKTADDISNLVGLKWRNHPLAMAVGVALYEYLEKKCKAKNEHAEK